MSKEMDLDLIKQNSQVVPLTPFLGSSFLLFLLLPLFELICSWFELISG